ncbi:MAG: uracil-DNA glycosylase family protein [Cyanobacteria bacterium P01_F01_bin.150]
MAEYLFSEFSNSELDLLHQTISKILNISKEKCINMYDTMRQEFDLEGFTSEISLPRNIFCSSDIDFQKRYNEALVIGVDIPSLLEKNDNYSNKKTIVILGQDPLRKSDKRIEDIGIATPYGMHLKVCREKLRNTRLYFDLIKVLLDEGYRVYLTDIFKVWVSETDKDKAIPLSRKDYPRFAEVLSTEVEIFKPPVVITWGKVASRTLGSLKLSINHLEFPHPSGANNGKWRKLMGQPATRENRISFWKQRLGDIVMNS